MSLDIIELFAAVEDHFDVAIPDSEAATLETVGSLNTWVVNELTRLGRGPVDQLHVQLEMRDIISRHSGVRLEEVVPEARFVDDLGMD